VIEFDAVVRLAKNLAKDFTLDDLACLLTEGRQGVTIELDQQDTATLMRLVSGEAIEKLPRIVYQPTAPPRPHRDSPLRPYEVRWMTPVSRVDVDHNTQETAT
jgi:hypothetical protein